MNEVLDRFLRYVKIHTTSDVENTKCPSSEIQREFGKILVEEMKTMGLQDVAIDKNSYVTGTLPANCIRKIKPVGFIAHMDTAPSFKGKNVNPQIHADYDGKDILLSEQSGVVLSVKEFPELCNYVGKTIITTNGTTLLGADDKAGIAEILTAIAELIAQPEMEHGEVRICFTPDEEIGRGADLFDVENFKVDFALTVDGGEIGEFVYENFNAAEAKVEIQGRSVHPGSAKNKMINSIEVANQFNQLLPAQAKPEFTEGYDGFIHIVDMKGDPEKTVMQYIIRDHDAEKFKQLKAIVQNAGDYLNQRYQRDIVKVKINEQYLNMKEKIEPHMYILDIVKAAMNKADIEMFVEPVRGGTDGARLSYMGLPTPNIFTGGHNFHGPYEFIPLESMHKAVEVIKNIVFELAKE
ncbi:MAG: peptidase T [Anaerolineaceae bacterium]|nr:peptidase T [Anaerolineaceae bacterium]